MVTRRKRTTRTKKRTIRKTKRARTTRRTSGKKGSAKVMISFRGLRTNVENVFGKKPMTWEACARKLLNYVNKKGLAYIK